MNATYCVLHIKVVRMILAPKHLSTHDERPRFRFEILKRHCYTSKLRLCESRNREKNRRGRQKTRRVCICAVPSDDVATMKGMKRQGTASV